MLIVGEGTNVTLFYTDPWNGLLKQTVYALASLPLTLWLAKVRANKFYTKYEDDVLRNRRPASSSSSSSSTTNNYANHHRRGRRPDYRVRPEPANTKTAPPSAGDGNGSAINESVNGYRRMENDSNSNSNSNAVV